MKRTQLQLDDATYQKLRGKAFQQGVSMAHVMREAVAEYLTEAPRQHASMERYSFIASGRSTGPGPQSISERHDDALAEDFAS
jgi:hypothetical protein